MLVSKFCCFFGIPRFVVIRNYTTMSLALIFLLAVLKPSQSRASERSRKNIARGFGTAHNNTAVANSYLLPINILTEVGMRIIGFANAHSNVY